MKIYIKSTFHFLLIGFVLFALSPCSVKGAIFQTVNMEYSKPLNKSKTTVPSTNCWYSEIGNKEILTVKTPTIKKKIDSSYSFNQFYPSLPLKFDHYLLEEPKPNIPPRYILYKCLKIDIV